MTRSRKSAKDAGTKFAQCIADGLAMLLDDDRIERRTERGKLDRGDIASVRTAFGDRVVVECKDFGGRIETAGPLAEAEQERLNDGADIGVVAMKRKGVSYNNPGQQLVFMTVEQFARLLRPPRSDQ